MTQNAMAAKRRLIRVARGLEEADLVLKRARYLNVFTETWERGDIAIAEGRIAGIGEYSGVRELACDNARVAPGFIDSHIHLESALLSPAMFASCVIPYGTTAVICDPHEIANVMGADGIRYMLEATEGLPMDVFIMLPSCVPATREDENFAALREAELEPFYALPRVLGLAEMMDDPGVLNGDEIVLQKLIAAQRLGKPVDGHAPRLTGKALQAYIAAGVETDHECTAYEEALEKLKSGQWIQLRQGTAACNLAALLPLLRRPYASRCVFATDDKHPADLVCDGHIDGLVRMAIAGGTEPILALKAASWNAAQAYHLRDRGAVAPGRLADLVLLDDRYVVTATLKNGEIVYDGNPVQVPAPPIRAALRDAAEHSFHLRPVREEQFARAGRLGVLRMVKGQIITEDGGMADGVDVSRDLLKIAVLERHHDTGHVGVGYLSGYGLQRGAVATSIAHDSHNLIVVGTNDRDMAVAAERVRQLGGGIVIAENGQIVSELALPIAGLMTDQSAAVVTVQLESMKVDAARMGVAPEIDPFMTLSFMSLPVIPTTRILTRGVYDVTRGRYVTED